MRGGLLASLSIIAAAVLVGTVSGAAVNEGVTVEQDVAVDLHHLCEEVARSCWDLDPEDLGMTPLTASLPPAPEGTLHESGVDGTVHVKAQLLGRTIHLRGGAALHAEAARSGNEEWSPDVPCYDARGCPDLLVDGPTMALSVARETATFPADDCAVVEGSTDVGERTLLRFTFQSPNVGSGDLIVGDPDDHPEWFEWGECHGHWHFREYADYRLWDPAGYAAWKTLRAAYPHAMPEEVLDAFPELRDHFRAGHKQGFCARDSTPWLSLDGRRTYDDCDSRQGISVHWADTYWWFYESQWVDVTGLPSGPYVLESEVNPERLFTEESYNNNDAAYVVHLP